MKLKLKIKITERGIYGTYDKILHFVLPQYTYFICFICRQFPQFIHAENLRFLIYFIFICISRTKTETYALKVEQLMKEFKEIVRQP